MVSDKNALWTPGDSLQVWIPDSARKTTYHCRLCGKSFGETEQQQWVRHVKACAKRNDDAIQEEMHERDNDILFRPMDKERYHFMRQNPRKKRRIRGVVGS